MEFDCLDDESEKVDIDNELHENISDFGRAKKSKKIISKYLL